jgi:hypothetical protein
MILKILMDLFIIDNTGADTDEFLILLFPVGCFFE